MKKSGVSIYVAILTVTAVIGVSMSTFAEDEAVEDVAAITTENVQEIAGDIVDTESHQLHYEQKASMELGEEVYANDSGDLYFYDENGEVNQYVSNDEVQPDLPRAEEQAVLEASKAFLASLVEACAYYELDAITYDENTYTYAVSYVHKIDGLHTGDIVYFDIDNGLKLVNFLTPRINCFKSLDGKRIDRERIKGLALQEAAERYKDHLTEAEVLDIILNTDEEGNIGYQVVMRIVTGETGASSETRELLFILDN